MRSYPEIPFEISTEERIFLSHIEDLADSCERDYEPKYSRFLDERQAMLVSTLFAGRRFEGYILFGGYEGAVRVMLCVYPQFCEPQREDFPIRAVEFSFRRQDSPTHSQFLGTIMSQQLERSTVGDIVIESGRAVVFLCDNAADSVMFIEKVGRVGVKPKLVCGTDLVREDSFEELSLSVTSLRLDCIVSAAVRLSRDKTSAFIKSEGIEVNHRKIFSPDTILRENDVFSVRGKGKFILADIGGRSRRDRIFITVKKYK